MTRTRRTLSGKRVPKDEDERLGWIELLAEFAGRQQDPEPLDRLGEYYLRMRDVPHPESLKEVVCSLCAQPVSAKECRKGDDVWDAHAPAEYRNRHNRQMRRRSGRRGTYTKELEQTLGTAWVDRHTKG